MDIQRRKIITGIGLLPFAAKDLFAVSDRDYLMEFITSENKRGEIIDSQSSQTDKEYKSLSFINVHTGEDVDVLFKIGNQWQIDGLRTFEYIMRDYRAHKETRIDPQLLEVLYTLQERLDNTKPIKLLSGYRTARTNRLLKRSGRNVAQHSLHIKGQAADIAFDGKSVKQVARVARSLQMGGVGQYNSSHFVHVDTGRVRHWYG